MTKSEFIDHLAHRSGLDRSQAARTLDAGLDLIAETLAQGGDITIPGFGKFHVADRSARKGVNPRTGQPIQIAAARVPKFTAGSGLKLALKP